MFKKKNIEKLKNKGVGNIYQVNTKQNEASINLLKPENVRF